MSKAYKCDRCGKLYESKERTLEFKEHAVLKPHIINYEKIGNPDTYLSHVADLCLECQKQLEIWMKGTAFEIPKITKDCSICEYSGCTINTEPCFSCLRFCKDCIYDEYPINIEPCCSCHFGVHEFWQPKEEKNELH